MNIRTQFQPCSGAEEWLRTVEHKPLYQQWRTCQRGDWLLWLAAKLEIDRKLIVLAACDCAEPAMRYVPAGENRPQKAIETARKWCRDEASLTEVSAAAAAADAAYVTAYAAAAYAAFAAAYAAFAAAAAADAADAAYAAARCGSFKTSAILVRKRLPWTVWRNAALAQED